MSNIRLQTLSDGKKTGKIHVCRKGPDSHYARKNEYQGIVSLPLQCLFNLG